jgi:hypothetical protein
MRGGADMGHVLAGGFSIPEPAAAVILARGGRRDNDRLKFAGFLVIYRVRRLDVRRPRPDFAQGRRT